MPECLSHYAPRVGSEKYADILKWLDTSFEGRSRLISCFTEPLRLNGKIIAANDGSLFSFDIEELVKDNLIESIYRKIKSGKGGQTEEFEKVELFEIDYSPLDFSPYKTKKK